MMIYVRNGSTKSLPLMWQGEWNKHTMLVVGRHSNVMCLCFSDIHKEINLNRSITQIDNPQHFFISSFLLSFFSIANLFYNNTTRIDTLSIWVNFLVLVIAVPLLCGFLAMAVSYGKLIFHMKNG